MSDTNDRWREIVAFVRRQTATTATLTRSTELQRDLGLEGDEAFDFVESFAETFHVNSGDFEFHRYFGSEGFNPLSLVADLFRRPNRPIGVTLGMLEKAAVLGVWETTKVESGVLEQDR